MNHRVVRYLISTGTWLGLLISSNSLQSAGLQRLHYNNTGLVVDLGVGLWAWPLPMDYDGDGDNDLIVSCPDKPFNGTYFYENTTGNVAMPIFEPAVKIGDGHNNIQVSYQEGSPHVLVRGREYRDFRKAVFGSPLNLPVPQVVHQTTGRIRANQWKYADYDGDGSQDLIVGVGDWGDYGWDDAYNAEGEWTNGPLHGYVYLLRNKGTTDDPAYERPVKVHADGRPIDVFGRPTPNFADFDKDGDLDLICGEFLDRLSYFENIGSRTKPKYAARRFLESEGEPIRLDLQMIVPVAFDWDQDGDLDLVVGDEDGRVALVEHTGRISDAMPVFLPPKYFQQHAEYVKFGALSTPVGVDWDDDGDEDIISGNTAGYIGMIENLGGGETPRWNRPKLLTADGTVIRIQAGENGSIQGPCEAKWGYTTLSVADWDHDGRLDLVVNSIWGEILWYRNVGRAKQPRLSAAQKIEVEWEGTVPKPAWCWWNPRGKQLVTQWRTTPIVVDFNGDELNDLVMLDHEGYLCLFERKGLEGKLLLQPPRRMFVDPEGKPWRLNPRQAGKSGRRKLHMVDWDGDGRLDLLANSLNADLYRNVTSRDSLVVMENGGLVDKHPLGGHSSSPTSVDWDGNGIRDLLVGAEDGHFYYLKNPRAE